MGDIYKVAIVGCGSIGCLKPDNIDGPGTVNILTHAHAVDHHPRTELQALVDTNPEQLRKAIAKWNPKRSFHSVYELEVDPEKIDIVIISVPTEAHYEVYRQVLNLKPKLIIVEKPFCQNLSEIWQIFNDKKEELIPGGIPIPIMVNYVRRFTAGYQQIQTKIQAEDFGEALNCRVLYTRGLVHEGCHAIDLMNWFFDRFIDGSAPNAICSISDRDAKDPTKYVDLEFKKCTNVVFQPCDGRLYGIFEVDICFEKTRIRFIDNGLYYEQYPIIERNEWGHKALSYKLTDVIRRETGLEFAMYNLINNAVNFLDGKEKLLCTENDAFMVHEIINGL